MSEEYLCLWKKIVKPSSCTQCSDRKIFSSWWWGRTERKEREYIFFSNIPHVFVSPHSTLVSPHMLTLETPLDFLLLVQFLNCCFSGWKQGKPQLIQMLSNLVLSPRPRTQKPLSSAQKYLTNIWKILCFFNPSYSSFHRITEYRLRFEGTSSKVQPHCSSRVT